MTSNVGKGKDSSPTPYRRMHLHVGNKNEVTYQELINYCKVNNVKPTPVIWEAVEKYLKSVRNKK